MKINVSNWTVLNERCPSNKTVLDTHITDTCACWQKLAVWGWISALFPPPDLTLSMRQVWHKCVLPHVFLLIARGDKEKKPNTSLSVIKSLTLTRIRLFNKRYRNVVWSHLINTRERYHDSSHLWMAQQEQWHKEKYRVRLTRTETCLCWTPSLTAKQNNRPVMSTDNETFICPGGQINGECTSLYGKICSGITLWYDTTQRETQMRQWEQCSTLQRRLYAAQMIHLPNKIWTLNNSRRRWATRGAGFWKKNAWM